MKFYIKVTCERELEIETEDYESAVDAAHQQVSALLPERKAWKPQIDVSAVRGVGNDRYYVQRHVPQGFVVRERQLEHQTGEDNPGIHSDDPMLRPFRNKDDAHAMNEVQRGLDKRYGRWVKHAVTPEITGEGTRT